MKIPKLLHQIWFQGINQVPENHQNKIDKWKNLHPDFEYIFWDENSMKFLIENKYPQFLDVYNSFKYMHQKIDFFKYLVLYHFGGIYADVDTVPIKSLNGLLKQFPESEIIVGKMPMNGLESLMMTGNSETINNGIIMGVRNHPLFKKLLEDIYTANNSFYFTKYSEINNTTGPSFFTNIVNKFKDPKIVILDSDYLEPCYHNDPYCKVSKKAFTDHQHSQTWISPGMLSLATIYYFLKNNLWIFIPILFFVYKKRN